MRPPSTNVERLVAVIVLAMAFLVMASIFDPHDSGAQNEGAHPPTHGAAHHDSVDPHAGLPSLGELFGDDYVVEVYSTPHEPLYTVYDTAGRQLGVLLTEDEVGKRFPDLPIPDLDADTPLEVHTPTLMDASASWPTEG